MDKDALSSSIRSLHSSVKRDEYVPEEVIENPLVPKSAPTNNSQPVQTLSVLDRDELLTQFSKLSLSQISLIIEVANEAKEHSKSSTLKQYAEMLKEDGVSLEELAEFMGESFVRLNRPQNKEEEEEEEDNSPEPEKEPTPAKGKRKQMPRPKTVINYILDNIDDEDTTAADMVSYIHNQLGLTEISKQQIYNLRNQARHGTLKRKK